MKKITFKSVSSTLSPKEMKNVLGGSFFGANRCEINCDPSDCPMDKPFCSAMANHGNGFATCTCISLG